MLLIFLDTICVKFNSGYLIMDVDKYDLERQYFHLIDEPNVKEEDIHQFIVKHPVLTPLCWPVENRVFTKLHLGNQHVVDFAFAREDSLGLKWHLVEIERPQHRQFTKDGDQTALLSHGLRQLLDWENWFQENRDFVKRYFPYGEIASRIGLAPKLELTLVIGRRNRIQNGDRARLSQLAYKHSVDIMSFDRLANGIANPCCDDLLPLQMCKFVNGRTEVISEISINTSYSVKAY